MGFNMILHGAAPGADDFSALSFERSREHNRVQIDIDMVDQRQFWTV